MDPTVPDLGGFWDAMGQQHWPLVVGIGLTLVVWLIRSFVKHKLPPKVIPYVTLALAVIGTAGSRMVQAINEDRVWWQGLIQGVLEGATVGFSAMGWWSSGMKRLPLKKDPESHSTDNENEDDEEDDEPESEEDS